MPRLPYLPSSAANAMDLHNQVSVVFSKTKKSQNFATVARKAMDKLLVMGEAVEPDDVIETASDLVARGLDPRQLAALLASMPPTGGEALAQWVEQQDQQLRQQEALATKAHEATRHQLAVQALHVMGTASMEAAGAGASAGPPPQGNPLVPGV